MTTPSTSSDEDLLQRMMDGDEEAFTTLYRRRQSAVYRFALQMSGSPSVAEDVTQEVFLVLIREAQHYDRTRGPLSTYLYGIARNHVLRSLERGRAFVPIDADSEQAEIQAAETWVAQDDPLGDLTKSERIDGVRKAILVLPAHYREVVVLCDLHEMSYAEAASVLGCALGTVRSRLNRAHALLVRRLRSSGKADSAPQKFNPTRCCHELSGI